MLTLQKSERLAGITIGALKRVEETLDKALEHALYMERRTSADMPRSCAM